MSRQPSYAAPLGLASRPFQGGGTFPGAPAFATPAGAGLRSMGFPVSNGPGYGGGNVGGFASGATQPNRFIGSTDVTNGQLAYHFVCKPSLDGESDRRLSRLGLGALCFARVLNTGKSKYPAGTEKAIEVFELTQLNDHLKKLKRTGKPDDEWYETADHVAEAFRLVGVIASEVAPANDGNSANRNLTRVINFAVRGRCRTFNLWAGAHPVGTPCFLIIKMAKNVEGSHYWRLEPFPNKVPSKSGKNPHSAYPELSDLMYDYKDEKMETSEQRVGIAVYVGKLGDNAGDVAINTDADLFNQGLFHSKGIPVTTELFIRV